MGAVTLIEPPSTLRASVGISTTVDSVNSCAALPLGVATSTDVPAFKARPLIVTVVVTVLTAEDLIAVPAIVGFAINCAVILDEAVNDPVFGLI